MLKEQVIIIGGGPAGLACAIQLKRYNLDPLLFERDSIGGLVKNAWRIDNYPGFPDGISGMELVEKLETHIKRFDIRYSISDIRNSSYSDGQFFLESFEEKYSSEYLVLASGTRAKTHFDHIAKEYPGRIFSEVHPIREIKGKRIDIVGAGDAAFDYAMTLSVHNEIRIINRGVEIRCVPALLEIANMQPNISYVENSRPDFTSDYTIFATGREPDTRFLSDELIKMQELLEQEGLLYVIGDVKNGMVRQATVAIGDGVKAAMAIMEQISG